MRIFKNVVRALTSRGLAWAALLVVVFTTCRPQAQTLGPAPSASAPVVTASATPPPIPPLPAGARIEDEKNTIAVFRSAAQSTVFVTQTRVV